MLREKDCAFCRAFCKAFSPIRTPGIVERLEWLQVQNTIKIYLGYIYLP